MTAASPRSLVRAPFVLPPDVLVFPVSELSEPMRARLGCAAGDLAVTRPGYRSLSRIVDPDTAALLEEFRQPSPIAEAVARFSRRRGLDPERLLDAAFPVLQAFSAAQVLVPQGSAAEHGVVASFGQGQEVAGYEIRRLVRALEDTELYQAADAEGGAVALKIARPELSAATADAFEREIGVLERVGGACAPKLVGRGLYRGRPFLVTRWLSGVPITRRAGELRDEGAAGRRRLHTLCCRLLAAYRTLHGLGVVHGDVHSGNVLVDGLDRVVLLDFGVARRPGGPPVLDHDRRAGMIWFLEPEAVRALAAGEEPPPASFAGEQYAVAALVYQLLCGEHHLDGPPEREALYRCALEQRPLPFARWGRPRWPPVERVLGRALAKRPEERYVSVAELLAAFRATRPGSTRAAARRTASPALGRLAAEVIARAAERPEPLTALFPSRPTASLQYGAAGLAWFLYRAAQLRESAALAAAADLWARRAVAERTARRAFEAPEVGIRRDRVGRGSFHHRAPGVHAVAALIAHARGDFAGAAGAVRRFLRAWPENDRPEAAEVAFGDSGSLIGGALLVEALRGCGRVDLDPLATALRRRADALWSRLAVLPPIGEGWEVPHLGIAHGWAGLLYAQLRVRRALGVAVPSGLAERLDQLARRAEPAGRGVAWSGTVRQGETTAETPAHAPGWCAGTAGHLFLWLAAYEAVGEPRWLDLAERAAWHAWEHPDRHPRLCCGLTGRSFALLALYRRTGERAWLDRARRLADCAGESYGGGLPAEPRALSLYWGALGPALLGLELEDPELAAFPGFEEECWPS